MQTFSDESLRQMAENRALLHQKGDRLARLFLYREFRTASGKEYATHGFMRRISLIIRSIDNVFSLIPPETLSSPERSIIQDVTMLIQSNVINISASIDNLAWIWVAERDLKKPNGMPLSKYHIGLGPENKTLRKTFSEIYRKLLSEFNDWFQYHDDFRDALAHRISLYIPPCVVDTSDGDTKSLLEIMNKAEASKNFDLHHNLGKELQSAASFRPYMLHSLINSGKAVVFHPQILTDFETLFEIASGLIAELDAAEAL